MKSYSFSLLFAALFVAGVSAQLTVNTPTNVVVCAPLTVTWTGGTPPYFLSVHSGNDINGTPLLSFPSTNTASVTWPQVNYTVGTSLDLSLRDSSGLNAQSAIFTVQAGAGDTSCLNGSATPATPATSNGATPAATTTPSTGSTAASKATSTAPGGSSGSSASTPKSTSNAAMATGATYAVAGLLGAVAAAVFV